MDETKQNEPARITLEELFKKIFSSIAQLIDSFPITEEEAPTSERDATNSGP